MIKIVKFGKLYTKSFGKFRFRDRKKKQVDIKGIKYQKPERQIGLDEAIRQEQARKKKLQEEKKQKRTKRIASIRKQLSRLQ